MTVLKPMQKREMVVIVLLGLLAWTTLPGDPTDTTARAAIAHSGLVITSR